MLCIATKTPDQSSTPIQVRMTLYQNIFQGEPAISGFDWHITSYHNSSEPLAADTGADLHPSFDELHPGHGKLTRFRVIHIVQFVALFRLAFTVAPPRHRINLHYANTRRLILQ